MIKQEKGKYHLYSKDGSKHLGGPYDSREEAEERERQVNYHKSKSDSSTGKGDLVELSMVITKATLQPDGSMRWQAVTSDTTPDNTGESTSLALFQDWIARVENGATVEWLPPPRKPFLGISHYSDLDGYGEAGVTNEMWIQGERFKAGGNFRTETPLGPALFEAVKSDTELARKGAVEQPIRISAAWWDIAHSHGPFVFERKSLTDVCPMCAKGDTSGKVYLKGQLDHFAATRVPINPRTSLVLTERAMTTRKEDAATIVAEELAEELEEKSRLVGKSEAGLVVKAGKKPPVEEEEEEGEEETDGKKKPKGGSFLDKAAVTWEAAKALPEAATFTRLELMGLVRRNISEQPEEERLGMLEALLEDVGNEVQEIKTAVEELYFGEPAALDDLLFEPETEEDSPMADYLDEFNQAVTETLGSDQPAAQKAQVLQEALNKIALSLKAELETPAGGGDVAQALRAALAPITEQIAQINARLGVPQNQQAVIIPVQKSVTAPTVQTVQPENQLPISPITGQQSALTAQIRRSVGIY